MAVRIFRMVETERKRRDPDAPFFLPYASHFISMCVGMRLGFDFARENEMSGSPIRPLAELVDHRNVSDFLELLDERGKAFYDAALELTSKGLKELGITDETQLPRVAATFRRGDLLYTAVAGSAKARETMA